MTSLTSEFCYAFIMTYVLYDLQQNISRSASVEFLSYVLFQFYFSIFVLKINDSLTLAFELMNAGFCYIVA